MAVPKEFVKPKKVNGAPEISLERLERKAAGDWVLYGRVRVDVFLTDGRRVFGERLVAIRCQQEGRKPPC